MEKEIGGIIRAVLASAGGGLVAQGYLSADQMQTVSGAVAVLLVAVWSVIQKRMEKKK